MPNIISTCSSIINLKLFNNDIKYKKKIAFIIGTNYKNYSKFKLNGANNDTCNINNLLINHFNYNSEYIYIYNDNTLIKPTKQNILNKFNEILQEINSIDTIFFYFSGHGYINYLLTCDLQHLFNYEIVNTFIDKIPPNINFYGIFDCCHSENFLSLNNYWFDNVWYNYNNYGVTNKWYEYFNNKKIINIIIISACSKYETTIEYTDQGIFTKTFIDYINSNKDILWSELINQLKKIYKNNGLYQTPIIASTKQFDLNGKIYF